MTLPLTGDVFIAFADRAMDAVAMVPEDKRDLTLWSGVFDERGTRRPLSAMTPARLAADIVVSFGFFLRVATGAMKYGSPEHRANVASADDLAARPMVEIARLGRERARAVARAIDTLRPETIVANVEGAGRPFSGHEFLAMELAHLIHHRGQLYWLLRAMGLKPPAFV